MDVNVSTLSASTPTKPFEIRVHIREDSPTQNPKTIPLTAFIDSGAMGNFIHPCVVKQHRLPLTPRATPLELQTVTGNKFYAVKQQAHVTLTTRHGHEETIALNVAPVGRHDLLLGLPWCQHHGIQFDWVNRDIAGWSPDCEGRCFHTPVAPLLIHKKCPDATVPHRATEGAIGYDLHAQHPVTIPPATRALVPTGISIEAPEGTYGRIAPRSGLASCDESHPSLATFHTFSTP